MIGGIMATLADLKRAPMLPLTLADGLDLAPNDAHDLRLVAYMTRKGESALQRGRAAR